MSEPARCQDCQREVWLPSLDVAFDEAQHCLSEHLKNKPGTWPDQLACKDRTIARLRARLVKAAALLKVADVAMAEAEEALEVTLG